MLWITNIDIAEANVGYHEERMLASIAACEYPRGIRTVGLEKRMVILPQSLRKDQGIH